eukprot:3991710-Amphidinium_carterae.1
MQQLLRCTPDTSGNTFLARHEHRTLRDSSFSKTLSPTLRGLNISCKASKTGGPLEISHVSCPRRPAHAQCRHQEQSQSCYSLLSCCAHGDAATVVINLAFLDWTP